MTNETTNEQPIKTTLNLPVEVIAVPRDNDLQLLGTASDTLPMPINVKVKIKNTAAIKHHGIVSVLKSMNSKTIRLVNSDQTIMSFDLLMEAEKATKHQKKSHNRFLQLFKAGGCLSIQNDDDMYTYMPDSSYSPNKLQGRSNIINPETDNITENFSLKKHVSLVDSVNNVSKTPRGFLGKCKPGGCLDPPYSEDKYIYKPQIKKIQLDQENMENESNKDEKLPDTSEVEQKSKDLNKSVIEEIYSNSLITYPILSSTRSHIQEENAKRILRSRLSSDNKVRTSKDEFSKTYFMPLKQDKNRTSDTNSNDKYSDNKGIIYKTEVIDGKEVREIITEQSTNSPIPYQTSESKVSIEVMQKESNITEQKSVEKLSLQGRQLLTKIGEPSIVTSSEAILIDDYFRKTIKTSEKIVDNVQNKQNYLYIQASDENYSENKNKKKIVTELSTNSPITYQTSESKVEVIQKEPNITELKSSDKLSLQGRQLLAKIGEPSKITSSEAILNDDYFRKTIKTSEKIVDNVKNKQNYLYIQASDEIYSENKKKIITELSTNSPITYQTSESKVEVIQIEPNITELKSSDKLSLQGRQLLAKIEEPSKITSSEAILNDDYFRKTIKTSEKIVDNVQNKENYLYTQALDENYSKDKNKLELPLNNQKSSEVTSLIDINKRIQQKADDPLYVVAKNKESKDSIYPISTNISNISIMPKLESIDSIAKNSILSQNSEETKSQILETKSSNTKNATQIDVEVCSIKSSLYSEKSDVKESTTINSALDLPKSFENNKILDDQLYRRSRDLKSPFIDNSDINENNDLKDVINDSKRRDDFISPYKYSHSSVLDKPPQTEDTFKNIVTNSDQSLNKTESKLKSSQYSGENVAERSNSAKSAVELPKTFDDNKVLIFKESTDLKKRLVNNPDDNGLLAENNYNEKLLIEERPQIKESFSNNILIDLDQNMNQQEVLDNLEPESRALTADLQVLTNNLPLKKSFNEIESMNQIENTVKSDKMPFDTNLTIETSSEAKDKIIVQEPQRTNNIENDNAYKTQQNSEDDLNEDAIKYDQLKKSMTKKKTSNLLIQNSEVVSPDTRLNEDISISVSREKVTEKSGASETEDDIKYNLKQSNTFDSQAENVIKRSVSNLSSQVLISTKVDQKGPIHEIQLRDSKERQSLEIKSVLQSTKENIPSFLTQTIESGLNKGNSFTTSHIKKGESEKLPEYVSSAKKVPKTDNTEQKFNEIYTKENKTVDMKAEQFLNVNSFVKLNLGFQTQVNNKNEIEINTFDPFADLKKHPRDNVTIVKSILRENDEAICVPVNSRMDVTLQMEQSNVSTKHRSDAERKVLDKSTEISMRTDILLQKTLNSVYESLIPVKMIIQDLIRETDALSQQQQLFKELLHPATETSVRLIPSNKNCSCLNTTI